jgi:hypothetical protein
MIKLYRLTTGEDVIGEEVEATETLTVLKKPFVLIPMQQPGAKTATIGFTAYIPYSEDETIKIKTQNIVCEATPNTGILNAYKNNTSTIKSAKPSLIV